MYNISLKIKRNKNGIFFCLFIFLISFLFQSVLKAENGDLKGAIAGKIKPLSSPVRIAKGNKTLIYVSDFNRSRILVYKRNNFNLRIIKEIEVGGFPLGLAVFNDKFIFVGNASKNQVQMFNSNGKLAYKFRVRAKKPNDIAVSRKKIVYVVASDENLVKVYSFRGNYMFSFGGAGSENGEFNFPTGIAIDEKNGEIIVSDFLNKRVQVFDMNGNWQRSFGGGWFMSVIDRPQGISVDKYGNYHVVDVQQACVHVFDSQGSKVSSYGQYGKGSGQLRTPLDIVLSPDGSAFVTSNLNSKIEIFRGIVK